MKAARTEGQRSQPTLYLGKSPLQDLAGLSSHSSSQKPHFEQPLTIRPKATTLATMVSRLNMRNLMLRCDYRASNKARERKTVDEWFRKANSPFQQGR
jgi:hypothetical protein